MNTFSESFNKNAYWSNIKISCYFSFWKSDYFSDMAYWNNIYHTTKILEGKPCIWHNFMFSLNPANHTRYFWDIKVCYEPRTYGAKYSRIDQVKFIKGRLPQILLGPFLNTLSYISLSVNPILVREILTKTFLICVFYIIWERQCTKIIVARLL